MGFRYRPTHPTVLNLCSLVPWSGYATLTYMAIQ